MKTNATPEARDDFQQLALDLPPRTELWLGGSGASSVSKGIKREGLLVLDDLPHFERNLARLKAQPWAEARL